ncbi:MAG TPA: TadE family protein [Acidimicrobiia bacterium]|nr:TadE family protein [Acidimicrobiia bacterium]
MDRRSILTQAGGVALELAVTIPTLILVLLAMLEVVVVARVQLELVAAAREGARVAATVVDPAAAVRATQQAVGPNLSDRIIVDVTRPTVPGRQAIVQVSLRHQLVTPLLRWLSVDLSGRAVMRVER